MTIWRGSSAPSDVLNTDWHNPANWSDGAVPTKDDDVTFDAASSDCRLSGPACCGSLTFDGFKGVLDTAGWGLNVVKSLTVDKVLVANFEDQVQFASAELRVQHSQAFDAVMKYTKPVVVIPEQEEEEEEEITKPEEVVPEPKPEPAPEIDIKKLNQDLDELRKLNFPEKEA
jgi:hypothetical protein